jgi:hypothetical protein
MKRIRADGPGLRRRALALANEMRDLLGRLNLVRRQLAISLYRTRGRCGKPSCHCAEGPGHPRWAIGYWDGRVQHTRSVSPQQVRALGPRVEAYRRFRKERAALARLGTQMVGLVDRMQKLLVDRYRLPEAR